MCRSDPDASLQLEPVLDEISIKVRYGGASRDLKNRAILEISRVAQQLLPRAASLRIPPYRGISCRYRGQGHGFAIRIQDPLYEDTRLARERFRAMRYFHLGECLPGTIQQDLNLRETAEVFGDEQEKR